MRKILLVILLLKIIPCEAQNIPFAFWKSSGGTLDTVRMTTPSYGATGQSVTPIFVWTAVTNATSYVVELSQNFTVGIVLYRDTVASNTVNYSGLHTLNVGTQYYWRVRARAPTYTESPNVVTPFKFTTTSTYLSYSDSLFTRMGTSLTVARKNLIDSTIRMMRDSTVWDSLDVVWFTANSDTLSANQNWKSATGSYQLVRPKLANLSEPVFVADSGYKNTGTGTLVTGGYLNTSWTPSSNGVAYRKLVGSYGFWSNTTDTSGNTTTMGAQTNGSPSYYIYFTPNNGSGLIVGGINSTSTPTWTAGLGTNLGFFNISRTDTATIQWYHNGVYKANKTDYAVGRPTYPVYILSFDYENSQQYPAPHRVAIAYFGSITASASVRKLYNCFNYYMTRLSTHP